MALFILTSFVIGFDPRLGQIAKSPNRYLVKEHDWWMALIGTSEHVKSPIMF